MVGLRCELRSQFIPSTVEFRGKIAVDYDDPSAMFLNLLATVLQCFFVDGIGAGEQ